MLSRLRQATVLACVAGLLTACGGGPGLRLPGKPNPIESQLLAEIAIERGEYGVAVTHYLNVALQTEDPDSAQRATELAYEYGFDAHALAAAERWLKLDPDNVAARTLAGILQVRFDRQEAAWENLNVALGPPEKRTDRLYASLSGDLSVAARQGLTLFERFNASWPDKAGITRSLAELAAQTGDIDRAIEAARQTVALRQEWHSTRAFLARLLLVNGQRSSAFEQMSFALEMSPGLELELEFVRLLSAADELQSAVARLERVSARYPDELAVILTGAGLLAQAGQLDEAEAIYVEMLSASRCFSECYWQLGNIAFRREDYSGAIDLFNRVGPGERSQPAVLAVAQAWLEQQQAQAALAVLEQFAADYPKRAYAMLQPRISILLADQRYAEAAELSEIALEYRPWSEELWMSHGAVLEQSGKLKQALEAFRRAWEIAPESATTQNAYGYTLTVVTRRYKEAEQLIARALAQDPENPAIMDSMGWVSFKQGRRDEARQWLEKAFAAQNDPEIAAHLGEVLWVSGDKDQAREVLAAARTAFPDNRSLQGTIERLLD
jgi:tetratricopeptide (TPR) repeat protein